MTLVLPLRYGVGAWGTSEGVRLVVVRVVVAKKSAQGTRSFLRGWGCGDGGWSSCGCGCKHEWVGPCW